MKLLLTFIYGLILTILSLLLISYAKKYFISQQTLNWVLDSLVGGLILYLGISKI